MRDIDTIQEHEAAQHRLVEDIIQSLHWRTKEDEDYRKTFLTLSQQILTALAALKTGGVLYEGIRGAHPRAKFENLISQPIRNFTNEPTEQKLLLVKVFEKVFSSYASGIYDEYQRLELEKQ